MTISGLTDNCSGHVAVRKKSSIRLALNDSKDSIFNNHENSYKFTDISYYCLLRKQAYQKQVLSSELMTLYSEDDTYTSQK